jgi:hypothetical protein
MRARVPYVGHGRDGCERSAAIDRSEAETLDRDDPRRAELAASAIAWMAQARGTCPNCGSEEYAEWREGVGDDDVPRGDCRDCGLAY